MSVVLPASGCEMMANVRRRAISLAKSLFKKSVIGTAETGDVNAVPRFGASAQGRMDVKKFSFAWCACSALACRAA